MVRTSLLMVPGEQNVRWQPRSNAAGLHAEQRGGGPLKGHCQSLLASSGGHSLLLRAQRQVGHHQCRRGRKCHRILDQPLFTPREHHLTPAAHQVGSDQRERRRQEGREEGERDENELLLRSYYVTGAISDTLLITYLDGSSPCSTKFC